MTELTSFEVGKDFPVKIPNREGAFLELWPSGLVCIINMPFLKREEKVAFKKTFKRYSYLETDTNPPIAVWVFDFPNPHGPIDTIFDARRVQSELIEDYLDTSEGVQNAITFYLVDSQILAAQKLVGLSTKAIELFHDTIRKQVSLDYTDIEYEAALGVVYTKTVKELMIMGRSFKHLKRK